MSDLRVAETLTPRGGKCPQWGVIKGKTLRHLLQGPLPQADSQH